MWEGKAEKGQQEDQGQASWLSWPQARVNVEHNLVILEYNCMESLVLAPNLWVTCYELGQSTSHSRAHILHPQRRDLGQVISSSFNILWFFNPILGWKIWSQWKNIFPALTPRPHKFPLYEKTQREVHCDHPDGLMSWSFLHSHRPLPKVIASVTVWCWQASGSAAPWDQIKAEIHSLGTIGQKCNLFTTIRQ